MDTPSLTRILDENWDLLAKSPDPNFVPTMDFLADRMASPKSYVTLAGETSSGKSTLINSFLGRKFLVAGAQPTTGTVTWIEYGLAEKERLLAVNRDATVEEISRQQFDALTLYPDEKLLRLKAEIPGARADMRGLTVFDTPGFNAVISEHAEVLKEFLPESDVIVFPVSYKVGFGASDRKLMELIGEVCTHFGETPVILVVNRAPAGTDVEDKRVKEIRLAAEDSLHAKTKLIIVEASMPTEDGESTLPKTDALWKAVSEVAFAPSRSEELQRRFSETLLSLVNQRKDEIKTTLATIAVGEKAISELVEQRRLLQDNETKAYAIVDRYMAKIETELPKQIRKGAARLVKDVGREINNANKWVDAQQCQAYIYGHVLPFGTDAVVKDIENYLYDVFVHMDAELDELANNAIRHVENRAQTIENPELKNLVSNLALRLGQRIGGELASQAVRSVSGVGGAANGVGNLVKMGVKQFGKLFGKTFGREVYTQIGKIFTKNVVKTMSVCLQAAVELAFFAWDAHHWQDQLKEKAGETIDKWADEVSSQVGSDMVPGYAHTNRENVKEAYAGMLGVFDDQIDEARASHSKHESVELKTSLEKLETLVKKLEK